MINEYTIRIWQAIGWSVDQKINVERKEINYAASGGGTSSSP